MSDDWFSAYEPKAIVQAPKPKEVQKREILQGLEDSLLEESMDIVGGVLRFADIAPGQLVDEEGKILPIGEPPPAWVSQYGRERAEKMYRLALAGWASKKDAPVAIEVARTIMIGIIKARAKDPTPTDLNVSVVQVNVQNNYYYETMDETDTE